MTNKKNTLSNRKQLIDLNGDTTNFKLSFNATATKGESFDAVVVDQKTLDSGKDLVYKKANGNISGNIIADKNIYQNYFLLLKSDAPCECIVNINKTEIAPNVEQNQEESIENTLQQQMEKPKETLLGETESGVNYKKLLLYVIGAILFLYLLYLIYTNFVTKSSSQPKLLHGMSEKLQDVSRKSSMPENVKGNVFPVEESVYSSPKSVSELSLSEENIDILNKMNNINLQDLNI